jgi:phosphomannomutase
MISSSGKYYDCNFVGAVLYYYLIKVKKLNCSITKNYAITSLMYKLAESFEKNCYETVVGFKNIATSLLETDSLMGVEANGIAFKPHSLIKDGPLTAVLIIDAICAIGKSFDEILSDIQKGMNFKSHIVEYNYILSEKQKEKIFNLVYVQKKVPPVKGRKVKEVNYDDGCKIIYEDGYWGMFRFSGTEPLIRVYAEMKDLKQCNQLMGYYEKFLGIKTRQQ